MHAKIDKILKIRTFLLERIQSLNVGQLNKIPDAFNNNIIWNVVHQMAAQQGLCYLRSSNLPVIPEKFIMPFFTNTKPERPIEADELLEIKEVYLSSILHLQADYEKGIFKDFEPSPNILKIYGIELKTFEEVLDFILYHDGYHIGTILALKKLV